MKLHRIKDDGVTCLGLLHERWWTCERPWKNNALRVSCIPTGVYVVRRHDSPSKGDCWEVLDVPERTHILIHVANWSHELMGCIAPGQGIDLRGNKVNYSRNALNEMFEELPDRWELEIS